MKEVWLAGAAAVAIVIAVVWLREYKPASKTEAARSPTAKTIHATRVDPKSLAPATITGVVRDETTRAIADATVCVDYGADADQRCVKSGADGAYRIDGVVSGTWTIAASLAKHEAATADVALDPGEQLAVDLVVKSGAIEVIGHVEDILGGPIAKARVASRGVRVEADDRGKFSLWLADREAVTHVAASAAGYAPRSVAVRPARSTKLVIALSPESTIAGRVVDETGAPVADATVRGSGVRATTGADGTFTLEPLAAGSVESVASAPGKYGNAAGEIVIGVGERVEDVVITVLPARRVVATLVVDGDRTACNPTPALRDWSFSVPPPWRDHDGRFHFEAVPPSVYSVELACGSRISPLVVGNDDVEITWRVAAGGVVKGRVQLSKAPKSATAFLVAVGSAPAMNRALDGTGAFEFRGVPPGQYELSATIDRLGETDVKKLEVRNNQSVEHELVLKATAFGRVTGKVVDDRGRPVDAILRFYSADFTSSAVRSMPYATVKEGRYDEEVSAGTYSMFVRARGYEIHDEKTVVVPAGGTVTHDLVVRRHPDYVESPPDTRYEFAGRVVDGAGAPVAGAIVTAVDFGYWDPDVEVTLRTTSRADGGFAFVSKYDRMNVNVYRIGGGTATAALVAGERATITLVRPTTITGTVTRDDGTPAQRFAIRIGEGGAARTENFDHTGGRFAITVDAFPLTLSPVVNNVSGAPITITTASANVALRLPPLVTIRARIVDGATRKPIAHVRVNGRHGLGGWGSWFMHADQVTNEDGHFIMRDLPPGPMMLEIAPPADTWSLQTFNVEVSATQPDLGELSLAQVRRR